MKVVKKSNHSEKQSFTLRLEKKVVEKLDQISHKNGLSRQKLVENIIEQVLKDKKFILKIGE